MELRLVMVRIRVNSYMLVLSRFLLSLLEVNFEVVVYRLCLVLVCVTVLGSSGKNMGEYNRDTRTSVRPRILASGFKLVLLVDVISCALLASTERGRSYVVLRPRLLIYV